MWADAVVVVVVFAYFIIVVGGSLLALLAACAAHCLYDDCPYKVLPVSAIDCGQVPAQLPQEAP